MKNPEGMRKKGLSLDLWQRALAEKRGEVATVVDERMHYHNDEREQRLCREDHN